MRLWRISAHGSFDGEGARRFGGRWNRPGTAVVYAAATLALAMLEFLVHLDRSRSAVAVFAHYADVPDGASVKTVNADQLHSSWHAYRAPDALKDIGTDWARSMSSAVLSVPAAVLRVPSGLVTAERNFLINPAHADFTRIRVHSVRIRLDPRMWK